MLDFLFAASDQRYTLEIGYLRWLEAIYIKSEIVAL
jgi:hypothetical protein